MQEEAKAARSSHKLQQAVHPEQGSYIICREVHDLYKCVSPLYYNNAVHLHYTCSISVRGGRRQL